MFPGAFCGVVFAMRRAICAAATLVAGLLTACGAVAGTPAGSSSPSSVPATAVPAPPSQGVPLHTPPTNGPRTVVVGDQDNGHAVSLRAGDHLQLVLTSTYWQVQGSSDPNVLRSTVQPSVSPQIRGCVAGEGCGTVTALYDAVAPGRADLDAKRTSCGEAMSCTGNLGFYRVTVVVSG
jgi:hypothetical protein